MNLAAVNPATGEILERLDQQPAETLAEALDAINVQETRLKEWRGPIETELRNRLKLRQAKRVVFGDWEVEAAVRPPDDGPVPLEARHRWVVLLAEVGQLAHAIADTDFVPKALRGNEAAIGRLIQDGTVRAGEVADVITRTPVVSRSKAKTLLARLDGTAREQIAAACTWREKPGRLTVVRSVQLTPPLDIDPQELFAE